MEKELQGLPTHTGKGSGLVQVVILTQGEAHAYKQSMAGKVLATNMTNPGFARIMKESCAVITERGGRTCHAAVFCGEQGKPCVVGLSGLLSSISEWTGPRPIMAEVDGNSGKVTLVPFKPSKT